mgnify:CR=1 FL=1
MECPLRQYSSIDMRLAYTSQAGGGAGHGVVFGEKVTSPNWEILEYSCLVSTSSGAEAAQYWRSNEAFYCRYQWTNAYEVLGAEHEMTTKS